MNVTIIFIVIFFFLSHSNHSRYFDEDQIPGELKTIWTFGHSTIKCVAHILSTQKTLTVTVSSVGSISA